MEGMGFGQRLGVLSLRALLFCIVLIGALLSAGIASAALTINIEDDAGLPVTGFRWLIEEDNTVQTEPGVPAYPTIGTSIHKSHATVVETGEENGSSVSVDVDSGTPYVVSVQPYTGYSMGGKTVTAGQTEVTVVVHKYPLPTAQISIFVFNDNAPINNAPDAAEQGLAGFKILLDDTAGQQVNDAFGNPLGTTYKKVGDTWEVDVIGPGYITTDSQGEALIQFLVPGKYGLRAIAPAGQSGDWIQTSTIEGTPTIDAWVKAREPRVFVEGFGTGTWHVFFGFVSPDELPWSAANGGIPATPADQQASIFGEVNYNHFAQPPFLQGFHKGTAVPGCWVGLNDPLTGAGLIVQQCTTGADADGIERSYFNFSNIPAGTYELVTWDQDLGALFGFQTIVVNPGVNNIGNPPAQLASLDILNNKWFGELEGFVFFDTNLNGFKDPGERGMSDQAVNIRYRDGSIYQAQTTGPQGDYAFTQVFPFFKFLVVEVDFARYKATGMTAVVDFGGAVPPIDEFPYDAKRTPQVQADGTFYRTETGPVLTQAMQAFLGQYNRIDWGKNNYVGRENGGLSGMIFYAYTRAEDDPQFAVGDTWEPGIPRVQVALYKDANNDGIIDDLDGDGKPTLADVDNYPQGNFPGLSGEDIDNGELGHFDYGDAVQIVYSDSFDDNLPEDCIWGRPMPIVDGAPMPEGTCIDNFGVWNQVRPGLFDGGYAFNDHFPTGMANVDVTTVEPVALTAGYYIVQAAAPKGYILQKEEDKNVDFGDEFEPSMMALAAPIGSPVCVGEKREVPPFLSMQTGGGLGLYPLLGIDEGDLISAPFAGDTRPLCDAKQLRVGGPLNAAANFHFFTMVPKAARAVGFVNNDLGAEFDSTSPIYGEKPSPKWIPISFRDWTGNEVARTYTDEFGAYNALVPSTYTNNVPSPMGISPQMLTVFLNHPWLAGANGAKTLDPHYDPNYSQMAWTFMYYAGRSSYLDTPILPVGAHVGYPNFGVDVEPEDGTPVIEMVTGPNQTGPVLRFNGASLFITSAGDTYVANPDSSDRPEEADEPKTILRDFGFGWTSGQITIGGVQLEVRNWSNDLIEVRAPTLTGLSTGQLAVQRGDNGKWSELGVTVHVAPRQKIVYVGEGPYVDGRGPIQRAIDVAAEGTLIIVRPGVYEESPIVYKNVQLQGFGGHSTQIYPYPDPLDKLADWHAKVAALVQAGEIVDIGNGKPLALSFKPIEMPGFLVLSNAYRTTGTRPLVNQRLIDGFHITGSISGGGISVPDLGHYLRISNNIITGNQGVRGGGIVAGIPDSQRTNPNMAIRYNKIVKNSGRAFGGGGVVIYGGASNYALENNRIAGNFASWNGGGVCHLGLSDNGSIKNNKILFNEIFFGGQVGGAGGGIFVAGEAIADPQGDGSGDVSILGNLIQGNLAGSFSGGGIRAVDINGVDALSTPWKLSIVDNIIVNNVAAYDGGGISLQNAVNVEVVHNTIAHNDSTATSRAAFLPGQTTSNPQGAGIVSHPLSTALADASGQAYVDPLLSENIIWENRSFRMNTAIGTGQLELMGFHDLEVAGGLGYALHPQNCILTDASAYPGEGNVSTDPLFAKEYFNELLFSVVIDEGGNNISARFHPLTEGAGGYHLKP